MPNPNAPVPGYTPGPLMRDDISVTTFAPAGEKRWPVAIMVPDTRLGPDASMKRMRANATLYAAAPELLEAVIQYVSDLRYPPSGDSVQRRIERAEAALTKALGHD